MRILVCMIGATFLSLGCANSGDSTNKQLAAIQEELGRLRTQNALLAARVEALETTRSRQPSSEGPSKTASKPDDDRPDRSFKVDEQILLIDRKKRRYLVTLEEGGEFHTHSGFIPHDDIIGRGEGAALRSTRGATFSVFRPTLSDFVLKMPRGAQVIYPKDLGAILMQADIFPGARVLESGVGSGALSMTLLRAGAVVTGYELREDFAARAVKNVEALANPEALAFFRARAELAD